MRWVFEGNEPPDVPAIALVLGYIEPEAVSDDSRPVHAMPISDRKTVFEGAISFNSFRICHLDDQSQHSLLSKEVGSSCFHQRFCF